MTVVPADYTSWVQRFPEFASVTEPAYQDYFAEAGLYLDNTDTSVVPADSTTYQPRKMLLNLLTAHIAKLYAMVNGVAPSGLVGRVSEAQQGSVSVRTELADMPSAAAWFAQTPYGLSYWQATASYRMGRYRPSLTSALVPPLYVGRPY